MVKAPKTRALSIRFSEEEAEHLDRLSDAEDVSAATIIRKAFREYVARNASEPKTMKKPKK